MSYIVFDLEWNQPYSHDIGFLRRAGMAVTGEIIQIGAVKLDDNLQLVDTFNIIVKPVFLQRMHRHVKNLTGITDSMLKTGVPFENALRLFKKWCGPVPVLFSWGADDVVVLRENVRLHKIKEKWEYNWFDGQRIYSFQKDGTAEQIALGKAVEEMGIPIDLDVHNALHDSIYTARILSRIQLKTLLRRYDEISQIKSPVVIFPESLSFFVYDKFDDKIRALHDARIKTAFCPECQEVLSLNAMERTTGDKYLSIGKCTIHHDFAVLWKAHKYTVGNSRTLYYVTKTISRCNEEIYGYYQEKAIVNKEKEEKYQAYLKHRREQSTSALPDNLT